MDDAGAALAGVAADMRAGQGHRFTDKIDEKRVVRHVGIYGLSVQRDGHDSHAFSPNCASLISICFAFWRTLLNIVKGNKSSVNSLANKSAGMSG